MEVPTRKSKRIFTTNKLQDQFSNSKPKKKWSNINLPEFISHEDIYSHNNDIIMGDIIENLKDKEDFLSIFYEDFCVQKKIKWDLYNSESLQLFGGSNFSVPINDISINNLNGLRIAAIDGGLGFEQFFGVQTTLVKVAGVVYEFRNGAPKIYSMSIPKKTAEYSYWIDYGKNMDRNGNIIAGLRRQWAEIGFLVRFLHQTELYPDILLLDGSILPPPKLFKSNNQSLYEKVHKDVVNAYAELYRLCFNNGISLIGSVKDSNSLQLRDSIIKSFPFFLSKYRSINKYHQIRYRDLLNDFNDCEFLLKLLEPSSRTLLFNSHPLIYINQNDRFLQLPNNKQKSEDTISNINSNENSYIESGSNFKYNNSPYSYLSSSAFLSGFPSKYIRPVSKERDSLAFFSTYLKISPFDIPLRLEFLSPSSLSQFSDSIDPKISIINALSQIQKNCTIPIPQIQAHLWAHLKHKEFQFFISNFKKSIHQNLLSNLSSTELGSKNRGKNGLFLKDGNLDSLNYEADAINNISDKNFRNELFLEDREKNQILCENAQNIKLRTFSTTFIKKRHSRLDSLF